MREVNKSNGFSLFFLGDSWLASEGAGKIIRERETNRGRKEVGGSV